jgi:tetratricopeptide (TPR) repeat protein
MRRLIFCGIAVLLLFFGSCANNEDSNSQKSPEEKKLRDLIAAYPDSMLLKEDLVQYYRNSGNYQQAITETRKFLAKDSFNDHLVNMQATLEFENGDTAAAIRNFEKAIAINPRLEYLLFLGSLYAETKNPLALQLADGLLANPAAGVQKEALFIKGLYYNYAGEPSKAIPVFDSCIAIDYRYAMAYREKAIGLYGLAKYAEAVEVLKQAVRVQNSYDEGYYWMGRCYEKLGQSKPAIDAYRMALQFDPDYVEAKQALQRLGAPN